MFRLSANNAGNRRDGIRVALAFVLLIVLMLCAVLFACLLYGTLTNTLRHNGRWSVTKRTFDIVPMGAEPYYSGLQALARNRLNLGEWHGYQEVLFKEPATPERISFDFRLNEDAYVVVLFHRTETRFSGFRLSLAHEFPSVALHGGIDGEFFHKEDLTVTGLTSGRCHHAQVVFTEGGASLFVDDHYIHTMQVNTWARGQVGFLGGPLPASVDNVEITCTATNRIFRDSFNNVGSMVAIGPLAGAATLLGMLLLLLSLQILRPQLQKNVLLLLSIFLCLNAVLGILILYAFFWHAEVYPGDSARLAKLNRTWVEQERAQEYDILESRYAAVPGDGITRILFVGTSQTKGTGAARLEESFVRRVETKLNAESSGNRNIECINLAIRGDVAADQYKHYTERWIQYQPHLTVINLGNNDRDTSPESFSSVLEAFIRANEARQIQTLFVLEAVANVGPEMLHTHETMHAVGARFSVPVINAHAHLHNNRYTGFLWWDFVHPTSYGHRLLADLLGDSLANILDIPPNKTEDLQRAE